MTKKDESSERAVIARDFAKAVNMRPAELGRWLRTDDSKSVGFTQQGSSEAVGHASGLRIAEIKRKNKAALTDSDYNHLQKVLGFVRHLANWERNAGDCGGAVT